MTLVRLPLLVALVSALAAEAAPTCKQRVDSLLALAARVRTEGEAKAQGPVEVELNDADGPLAKAESRDPAWKTRGVRLVAKKDLALPAGREAALATDLGALAAASKVELCVNQDAPVDRKASLDADAKQLEPLLAEIGKVPAADRATLVAGHFEEPAWKCKGVPGAFKAALHELPAGRLGILAQGIAEALQECGCPDAEAERAYALLTLMADVWNDKQACAPLVLDKAGKAKPLALRGPVTELLAALQAGGAKGVVLPAAPPAKPAKRK